jgi:glucans biosynthesis protein C
MNNNARIYYIDWLRVIAFGLLFVFHIFRLFDTYPWHFKNNETSIYFNYIVEFMHSWRMYIIFLVSGAGTYFAMKSKREKFLSGRVKRLVIPYIFGMLILIPPQKFYEAIQQSGFEGSYLAFLTQLPQSMMNENFSWNLIWSGYFGHHIWYLIYLFIQTLLLLPILRLMIKYQNRVCELSNILFKSFSKFWVVIIPFVLLEFLLRPVFPEYLNWADFATFSLYFGLGFLLQINSQIIVFIEKNTYKYLLIAISCWSLYLLNKASLDGISVPEYTLNYFLSIILKNLNSIAWVLAFTGLGKKFFNFNHPCLYDLNQGILPFYILHQTLIIFVGYYIVPLNLTIVEKFALTFISSFILTIGLYQIIWRIRFLRFLFGMKSIKTTEI